MVSKRSPKGLILFPVQTLTGASSSVGSARRRKQLKIALLLVVPSAVACTGEVGAIGERPLGAEGTSNEVSTSRGIKRDGRNDRDRRRRPGNDDPKFRSIDGSRNNKGDESLGAAETPLNRWASSDYGDGVSTMAGAGAPSPRRISNTVSAELGSEPNPQNASDFLWQWGQFLDHDIDLTDGTAPPEPAPIAVPAGDPFFDPSGSGASTIDFNRSIYDEATGTGPGNPRQQLNEITHWIDASNVYGSDEERAHALRTNDGSGKLATSAGDLLPFNELGLPNAGGDSSSLFLAGDVRANEQVALLVMHTLFVREHNRLAEEIARGDASLSGDDIYQRARRIVGAQMQVITYREYLPALLGPDALDPYRGYDDTVDPRIANVFSTAIYRYGHSALSPVLRRLDENGNAIEAGALPLRDAFFNPSLLVQDGVEPLLRGLAAQVCRRVDIEIVDDVRNFLFGPPGSGGLDLASLNIQRGRDHGLPRYNVVRVAMGLPPAASFGEVTSDPVTRSRLAEVYASPDDIDVWVGALAEDPVNGGHVGELMFVVMKRQFEWLRDGDRYWYEKDLSNEDRRSVEETTLADIIRRNTDIDDELADDVFHVR